jgi:parallel beta-helix repeat protein
MGVWLVRGFQFNPSHPKGKIMMTEKTQIARWGIAALGFAIAVGFAATAAQANVINVPADKPTIQDAVDAAVSGDTILVAPGDYAGAWIEKMVQIIGSGPDTRITTGTPPWGDGFDVYGIDAAGTEISNLAIEVFGFSTGGVVLGALPIGTDWKGPDNCTIKDLKVTATWCGIYSELSDNVVVADNNISGTLQYGIWAQVVNSVSITNNTIQGEMWRAIALNWAYDSAISNNMIDRVISPSSHPWWNGAIDLDNGANNVVRSNQIMGEGRSAIHLYRTYNNSILDNDCSGYTGKWSGQTWNVCQFWDSGYSSGNTVSGNVWGPVAPESTLATVVMAFRGGASPTDDNILDNDYRQYNNVPGWTEADPDGPGCVLLTEGTENNLVFESGHFPRGTNAKSQVMDLGSNNRVVGHAADNVISPGIGQRLKAIQAQIDALPSEEVEDTERP